MRNTVKFVVRKSEVYNQIEELSAYIGAKKTSDEGAYERISVIDEDRLLLEDFWDECCNVITDLFKPFIVAVSRVEENRNVDLNVNFCIEIMPSASFDLNLVDSMSNVMSRFFVKFILGKWLTVTDVESSNIYLTDSATALSELKRKLYHKIRPQRLNPIENN